MLNEVFQWAILGVLAFLLLGVLRQISLMLPAQARAGYSGPTVGKRLPRVALDRIRAASSSISLDRGAILAFVSENCVGCQHLLANIDEATGNLNGQQVLLVARAPSKPFLEAITEIGIPVVSDEEARLWEACSITATPLVVQIDGEGRVTAKEVTHHVDAFVSAA